MRVIDPKQRAQHKHTNQRSRKWLLILPLTFILVGAVFAVLRGNTFKNDDPVAGSSLNQNINQQKKSGKLKTFTGEEFKNLYNTFSYPNTAPINQNTPITGNPAADKRIKDIASKRGYQMRSAPVSNAFEDVGDGHRLQQRAAKPWQELKSDAQKNGINLSLTAAYRSADEQREIFLGRLLQTGIPVGWIHTGAYDVQISQVLKTTAIPGYSRHHSGYTVDIACDNQPDSSFAYTACFRWLSSNNYEKAKTFGWIPSYPEETEMQGPDPESWEYVWVGLNAVTE